MTQLTPHFSLEELTHSDYAQANGIDNSLPEYLLETARSTAQMAERIRTHLSTVAGQEVPLRVSSAWRSPELDRAIRGRPKTGDHALMQAIDFTAPLFGSPFEVAKALAPVISVLGIGQLIYECPIPGKQWVHVSSRTPIKPVNRVITIGPAGPQLGIQRV
ncbi:MAG: D-Ala-D-Ala carboxypeptidase family metallohydrolase [Betaproteobacteria bacterium]